MWRMVPIKDESPELICLPAPKNLLVRPVSNRNQQRIRRRLIRIIVDPAELLAKLEQTAVIPERTQIALALLLDFLWPLRLQRECHGRIVRVCGLAKAPLQSEGVLRGALRRERAGKAGDVVAGVVVEHIAEGAQVTHAIGSRKSDPKNNRGTDPIAAIHRSACRTPSKNAKPVKWMVA